MSVRENICRDFKKICDLSFKILLPHSFDVQIFACYLPALTIQNS